MAARIGCCRSCEKVMADGYVDISFGIVAFTALREIRPWREQVCSGWHGKSGFTDTKKQGQRQSASRRVSRYDDIGRIHSLFK